MIGTFHTGLVGRDSSALDTDVVLFNGIGGVDGDLVIRLVAVLEPKVKVLNIHIHVRRDELTAYQ